MQRNKENQQLSAKDTVICMHNPTQTESPWGGVVKAGELQ